MKIDCPFYYHDGYEVEVEYNKNHNVKYSTYRRVNWCEILSEEVYCCGNKERCVVINECAVNS